MSTSASCSFVGVGSAYATAQGSFRLSSALEHANGFLHVSGSGSIAIGTANFETPPRQGLEIPVSVGRDGLEFRLACAASYSSASSITATFVASTASAIQFYGPTCDAELQGAWHAARSGHRFVFRTTRAPRTPWTFLLVGTRQVSIPLPPSDCRLLTDFPVVLPLPIDAQGKRTSILRRPTLRA
ncbi:MAG TPA: hypothetical protein PKE00_05030 [Planctomycetota bacterium]|nr:hypothetical protein [Planctomycetota bacterium]